MNPIVYYDKLDDSISELASLLRLSSSEVILCSYNRKTLLDFVYQTLKDSADMDFYEIFYDENVDLVENISLIRERIGYKFHRIIGEISRQKVVFSVFNLEKAFDRKESIDKLNLFRDFFMRIENSVLIWIEDRFIDMLSSQAPDFWRIRTKVFVFDETEILNSIGIAWCKRKDYKQGLEYFDNALSKNPKDPLLLFNKGIALGDLTSYKDALHYIDESLALHEDSSDRMGIARDFFAKSIIYYNLSRYNDTKKLLYDVVDIVKELESSEGRSRHTKSLKKQIKDFVKQIIEKATTFSNLRNLVEDF